jgi:hypothetical protein
VDELVNADYQPSFAAIRRLYAIDPLYNVQAPIHRT